jgi:hypothetical protein
MRPLPPAPTILSRLARGVKVVDTDPVSNPGSTQGGAEWRIGEYQPERKEPRPI